MRQFIASILLMFGFCVTADADIWKWVDDEGNVHFGDTPAREYTTKAERVSYTPGHRSASTAGVGQATGSGGEDSGAGETLEEQEARKEAQAYYCNKAREIYRSYADAPRLYRSSEDGSREYLSDQEAAAALADARASVAEWCD